MKNIAFLLLTFLTLNCFGAGATVSSLNGFATNLTVIGNFPNLPQYELTNANANASQFALKNRNHGQRRLPKMGVPFWTLEGGNAQSSYITNYVITYLLGNGSVQGGLAQFGYKWLAISDSWAGGRSNNGVFYPWIAFPTNKFLSNGVLVADVPGILIADTNRFPEGMPWLINWCHTNGFKVSLFDSLGVVSAANQPGALNHEFEDATNFMLMGVDESRIVRDDLGYPSGDVTPDNGVISGQYRKFISGLDSYSLPYSVAATYYQILPWQDGVINTLIISTNYAGTTIGIFDPTGKQTNDLAMFDYWLYKSWWIKPGSFFSAEWIGNGALVPEGKKRSIGLAALFSVDLMEGNLGYGPFMLYMTNTDYIAIDQDPDCNPPVVVQTNTDTWVYAKKLEGANRYAVGFLDRRLNTLASVTNTTALSFSTLGIPPGLYNVRVVWETGDARNQTDFFDATNSLTVAQTNDTLFMYIISPLITYQNGNVFQVGGASGIPAFQVSAGPSNITISASQPANGTDTISLWTNGVVSFGRVNSLPALSSGSFYFGPGANPFNANNNYNFETNSLSFIGWSSSTGGRFVDQNNTVFRWSLNGNTNLVSTVTTGDESVTSGHQFNGSGAGLSNIVGSAIMGGNAAIPVAVTVGASAFTFSNATGVRLECYLSDTAAFSVTKNGVAIYSSITSDAYVLLQPTNEITITYASTVPTLKTNAW